MNSTETIISVGSIQGAGYAIPAYAPAYEAGSVDSDQVGKLLL